VASSLLPQALLLSPGLVPGLVLVLVPGPGLVPVLVPGRHIRQKPGQPPVQ